MSRTAKIGLMLGCALLLAAALFFTLVPVRRSVTKSSLSILSKKTDSALCQAFIGAAEALPDREKLTLGPVYLYEDTYLSGRTETLFVAPYLSCAVRDVGAAGSADWTFRLSALAMRSRNGAPGEETAAVLQNVRLTLQADDNTVFTGGVSDLGRADTQAELTAENDYTAAVSVSTRDSALAPNTRAVVKAACTGELLRGVNFDLAAESVYISNGDGQNKVFVGMDILYDETQLVYLPEFPDAEYSAGIHVNYSDTSQDIPPADNVRWNSDNHDIIFVNTKLGQSAQMDVVPAIGEGEATITATYEGQTVIVPVSVGLAA